MFILKEFLKMWVFFPFGKGDGTEGSGQGVLQPAHPCQPAAAVRSEGSAVTLGAMR